MSFSTAFHSLRFPARSIAVSQLPRILALPTGSRTSSNISYGRRSPHSTRKTVPHAPHRHLDEAGPSRCFCTSHSNNKASELPLEELHYESSLDNYRHAQLSTSKDYWQFANTSSSTTSRFDAEPRTQSRGRASTSIHYDFAQSIPIRNLLSEAHQSSSQEQQQQQQQQQQQIHAPANDFFTPSVEQRPNQVKRAETVPDRIQSFTSPALQKSYIGSLNAIQRDALDSRVMVLIRSGERSMAALSAVYGELTAQEREQVCCSIMTHCIKHSDDPRFIFDLYRSWSSTIHIALDVPPGSTRTMIRRMQSDTLYLCATFLHRAGLIRQAARVVGDSRLKPSQSRYLLERLIYDLKLSPTLHTLQRQFKMSDTTDQLALHPSATFITTDTFAAVDARLAAREICDTMMNLMADGLSFRRKAINRTLKILCLTRARSRIVRLLRAAQRRAQIDLLVNEAGVHGGQSGELRTAGGFSRLRTEQVKPPQVVSTKVMEGAMRVLCAQGSLGARTAYELLSALDPLQRSATMYDALMTVYGNASIGPVSPTESGVTTLQLGSSSAERYLTVDEQLWTDMCSLSHLSGPTLQTISARIVCHARTRNLELIKCDLAYLRSSKLGTLHDLTNKAKLSIVRCCIESGSLLTGFRYATILLKRSLHSSNPTFGPDIVNTLLLAAQHIHINTSTITTASSSSSTSSSSSSSPPSSARRSGGRRSTPSRAQLLKRFLRHFSHLDRKFHPLLRPGLETLQLFIRLLDRHAQWIETRTLWNMLKVIGKHFGKENTKLVPVLEVFVKMFEKKEGEIDSVTELKRLIDLLKKRETQKGEFVSISKEECNPNG